MFEDLSGAALAAALADVDPAGLDAAAAVDYAVAMRRVEAWASAGEAVGWARAYSVYPDTGPQIDQGRAVAHEVSAALGCSSRSANKRLSWALSLDDLPATLAALKAGLIDVPRAWVMIEHTDFLTDPAARRAVEEEVLAAHAAAEGGLTLRQWHALAARAVAAIDAAAAEKRRRETRADREVGFAPPSTPGGDATLWLRGPAEQLAGCDAVIDALARAWQREQQHAGGQVETLTQLRFDAAVWLLTHATADRVPAGVVLANITVPLSCLLGLDDAPGEMDRVGPIPATLARELAAQAAEWRRLLTDPVDGHVVSQHLKSYRPSAAMRAFVLARAGWVCASRGCGARRGLQHDHATPHPQGATSADNLGPFCQPDHNIKTHGRWRHEIDPDSGAVTQISPLGRRYVTRPLSPVGAIGPPDDSAPDDSDCDYLDAADPQAIEHDRWVTEPPVGEDEVGVPPDVEPDHDRWAEIALRLQERSRARAEAERLAAEAIQRLAELAKQADREMLADLHRSVESDTDYDLIARLNAEDLAWLNAQHPVPHGPDQGLFAP